MTTDRKPRQKRTPTATQTADRLDREIRVYIEIRAEAQKRITEAMKECPEAERAAALRVLGVIRDDTCGFSFEVANETAPAPAGEAGQGEDDLPDFDAAVESATNEVEPTQRVEIDRETGASRRVGPGRGR